MKRELRITEDGSHTLHIAELDEPYHSIHGAIQESLHVFLEHGFRTINKPSIKILELGFGTGLNTLLTLSEANKRNISVHYHAVEKYPLEQEEYILLNYEDFIDGIQPGSLLKLHEAPWGKDVLITEDFTLIKELSDIRTISTKGPYDLVYFDAFAPKKQAHLWTEEVFSNISRAVIPGGVLVTYTSMGSVRRTLISCGFDAFRVPGPPGKRHMLRASRR